jgi:vacuolar-type H+-ATPase subunit I/STV1
MSKINYEEDRIHSITQADAAKSLSDKVIELKNLEDEIQNAEESVSKLKEKANTLSEFEIPKMMEEMHITKLKLKDGESVEIKKVYSGSILPENQEEAFTWLRDHDLGDIIKRDITVTFGQGEDNKASVYADLAQGQGYEPVQKIGVHPQTLKAVVMPSDLFKTYAGNRTKITRR